MISSKKQSSKHKWRPDKLRLETTECSPLYEAGVFFNVLVRLFYIYIYIFIFFIILFFRAQELMKLVLLRFFHHAPMQKLMKSPESTKLVSSDPDIYIFNPNVCLKKDWALSHLFQLLCFLPSLGLGLVIKLSFFSIIKINNWIAFVALKHWLDLSQKMYIS